jgi:methyltransferase (TIGR00027 family)
VHQVVDYPRVLDDPLAVRIVGPEGRARLQATVDRGSRGLRAYIALRSRYAEDRLGLAFARGVRQYVVLGAGLDTFAWRNPHGSRGLRVFEVDHPATQHWKRTRLQASGIGTPGELTFVPVDFERQTLREQLAHAGFRFDRPAFFSMLGVVIYLTEDAVMDTLRFVASCASGSEIVLSFSLPDAHLSEAARARRQVTMARLARAGEPWITFLDPADLVSRARAAGYASAEVLAPARANETYFAGRLDGLRITGSAHMLAAQT